MDQKLNLIVSFFKNGTGLCFFILLVLAWVYYGILYCNIKSLLFQFTCIDMVIFQNNITQSSIYLPRPLPVIQIQFLLLLFSDNHPGFSYSPYREPPVE